MIACLRSQKFMYPDYSASVTVELRRLHDTDVQALDEDSKKFVVTRRFSRLPGSMVNKSFGTLTEARRWWLTQVHMLEDEGLIPFEVKIVGFHEED